MVITAIRVRIPYCELKWEIPSKSFILGLKDCVLSKIILKEVMLIDYRTEQLIKEE